MSKKLPFEPAHELWNNLIWSTVQSAKAKGSNYPLEFMGAPNAAGLYRVSLINEDWWAQRTALIPVKASGRITDPHLNADLWQFPVLLTIGKTTNLKVRLRQHFGINDNNNRLLKRLLTLFPKLTAGEIRQRSLVGLHVEVVVCPDWRHRFLAEHYGAALCQPLFDFEVEH
ncbi:MAG TPA: GIY-YIG nuclease family protein [Candidatus Binatia bacterium]|jgi:hypothetical protein|nr:GIY-YIG nuclease family protein [Candidatus Binatia bacterium]